MQGILIATGTREGVTKKELVTAFYTGVARLMEMGVTEIILYHGCMSGVDTQAANEARARGGEPRGFNPADYGKWPECGPLRNAAMISAAIATGLPVVVFALPRGAAKGTRNCIKQARAAGLEVLVFEVLQ